MEGVFRSGIGENYAGHGRVRSRLLLIGIHVDDKVARPGLE